jgi:hypothetical protein
VERYQDVYPTKHITGGELFETLRAAARAFPRVAIYFENSVTTADWPLVPSSATPARVERSADGSLTVDSIQPAAVAWPGCALLDGRSWPAGNNGMILVPAGRHTLTPCPSGTQSPPLRLSDFNGEILDLKLEGGALLLTYGSPTRAIALLARENTTAARILPPGRHTVRLE